MKAQIFRLASLPGLACFAGIACIACLALFLAGTGIACQPRGGTQRHDLASTGGEVRFASLREDFYRERWIRQAKSGQPLICAGFVHHRSFGHYLKFGSFALEMTMEVIEGGEPITEGGRITGWRGGKLLRSSTKRRPLTHTATSYVICGRRHERGAWTLGAMRYAFVLKSTEPEDGSRRGVDEVLARGVLRIVP